MKSKSLKMYRFVGGIFKHENYDVCIVVQLFLFDQEGAILVYSPVFCQ